MTTPSAEAVMDGTYYAKGDVVWKSPTSTDRPNGGRSISLGFPVCQMHESCSDQAAVVAAALNSHAQLVAALERMLADLDEIEDTGYCSRNRLQQRLDLRATLTGKEPQK